MAAIRQDTQNRDAQGPSGGSDNLHVALLFRRIGPYHFARLKAAAGYLKVTAVEFSATDPSYPWDLVPGQDGFDRVTLFAETGPQSASGLSIREAMSRVLSRLQPSVVAIPGWFDPCALAALEWCARFDVPAVIMSETNAWDEDRILWREFVKRRLLRGFDAALVGGKSHAAYLTQLGLSEEQIFLGYDSVDNHHFAVGAETCRGLSGVRNSPSWLPSQYFLASARFIAKKNLEGLVRAYARYRVLPGARPPSERQAGLRDLVILGDGPLRPGICRLINEYGLADSIHLPGFRQYHELPEYYGFASAFIHPSLTEQWGLVVNEAMAAGLPVLVSDRCGCVSELVRPGFNGYTFDPRDTDQLAALMLRLSEPGFPLAAFGAESKRIVANWSPEKFGCSLHRACAEAIVNHSRRRARKVTGRWTTARLAEVLVPIANRAFEQNLDAVAVARPVSAEQNEAIPDFFVIGAPKSGTTSLCACLSTHPNIFFCRVKEPHFFDLDSSKKLKLRPETYRSLYKGADPAVHKAIGEGSTGYLFSKVAVAEILKFNPAARFLVVLRDPVEIVHAWYSEMYFEGVEDVADFEEAWRLEPDRRLGKRIPRACWEPKKLFYSDWGRLGEQVERLMAVAGPDKVRIILFDDLIRHPLATYQEVLSFLGVPPDGRQDFPILNENKLVRYRKLQELMAFLANYVRRARALSGVSMYLGTGMLPRLLSWNSRPARRKPLSSALELELRRYYRNDVEKLSTLLGRDLSAWTSDTRRSCLEPLAQTQDA